MPGAPTPIMKGSLIRKIDKRLAKPTVAYLQELEQMGQKRLSDVGVNSGALDPSKKNHADVDWFGAGTGWWPTLTNKEKKVRWAYIQALRIATSYQPARAIRTIWVAGVADTFQCLVQDAGDAGVLVFWVTPAVPAGVGLDAPVKDQTNEDLWVVGTKQEIDAIRAKYPTGYQPEQPVECEPGISLWKSTGY
jgi:hypothetical protein